MDNNIEILVVEENRAEAENLKHILQQHKYRVSVEHNPKIALACLRQNKPQIVISGVLFAETDGYELCREIKTDEGLKDVSVILLTSLSDSTDIVRGMECGADNFVTKPYDAKLLMSRIEFILLNQQLRSESKEQAGVEFIFHGKKYLITPERQQIVDLLISTFETAVQKNIELTQVQTELNRLNESLEEKVAERTARLTEEINERQAAEASLKEQKEFLHDVVDANPNPIFVKDRQGRFTLINKAMASLYGTTTTAIIGKTDLDLNGKKAEVERILFHDKQVLETKQSIHIPEEEFTHQKTGEVRWFQSNRIPLAETNGQVQQLLGVAVDITRRKMTEDKLRDSEQWLKAILDGSRDGIVIEDKGKIIYANNAFATSLQYEKPRDLIGKDISFVLPPDETKRMMEYGRRRLSGEQVPSVYEFKGKRKDGSLIDFEAAVSISVIGDKRYIMTAIRDITERKYSANLLQNNLSLLTSTFEATADGILVLDLNNEVITFNEKFVEMWGLPKDAVRKKDTSQVLACFNEQLKDAESFKEKLEKSLKQPEAIDCSVLELADGRFYERCSLPQITEGKVVGRVESYGDITGRKQFEEELMKKEARLSEAQQIANLGDWEWDITLNKVTWSNELYRICGIQPQDFNSTFEAFLNTVHPEDRESTANIIGSALQNKKFPDYQYRIIRPDGIVRLLQASGKITLDVSGNLTKILGTAQDITERKQAEQSLLESEERLQQSQKMEAIGTLTGGVAHDFNNLLTAILGNTQLAERKLSPDDPIRLRLAEISDAGKRAAELTGKLLAFSRRQHLERRSINLNDSVAEIVKLLERIIGEDVEISVKCATDLPPVFADAGQIEQVVMNLAVNGRDAMPAGGRLHIETCFVELDEGYTRQYPFVTPGRYVQIMVSDSGTGMDAETQVRIFEPYFTTKEIGKGTGMGHSSSG